MSDTCLIMMAAYNSERFLRQQLDSIENQSISNWELILQDDGSTDSTIDIIREYMAADERIHLRFNNGPHGAFLNFHSLIHQCRKLPAYDYYIFSDHDDVWDPDKLEQMLTRCHEMERPGRPLMVYGDLRLIDGDGALIAESVNRIMNTKCVSEVPLNAFFSHKIHGCNMLVNRSLLMLTPDVDLSRPIAAKLSHDNYFTKFAAIKGDITFIDRPLMSYRRYGENVTAEQNYSKGFGWLINRLAHVSRRMVGNADMYSQSLYAIKQLRGINLTEEEEKLLSEIETSIRKGGMTAVRFCRKHHISSGNRGRTLVRYAILLLGLYRKYLIE